MPISDVNVRVLTADTPSIDFSRQSVAAGLSARGKWLHAKSQLTTQDGRTGRVAKSRRGGRRSHSVMLEAFLRISHFTIALWVQKSGGPSGMDVVQRYENSPKNWPRVTNLRSDVTARRGNCNIIFRLRNNGPESGIE